MSKKPEKFRHQGNRAQWEAFHDIKKSGATMPHRDRRKRRAHTRSAALSRSLKEQE